MGGSLAGRPTRCRTRPRRTRQRFGADGRRTLPRARDQRRWTMWASSRENLLMTPRSTIADLDARVAGRRRPSCSSQQAADQPDFPLLNSMREGGGWNTWTVADVRDIAAQAAAGLLADGVAPGERILLMMRNRPDFHWLDLGGPVRSGHAGVDLQLLVTGGDRVPRRPRRGPSRDRRGRGIPDRMLKVRDELPLLEKIYVIDPPEGDLPEGVLAGQRADGSRIGRPRRARGGDRARRPRHLDLHLGHDRSTEGRDDQPVQRRVHRRIAVRDHRGPDRQGVARSCRTCRWPTSRSG